MANKKLLLSIGVVLIDLFIDIKKTMAKTLDPHVKAELEPSMQKYSASTKRAVTSLQQTLEWAEEDMMVAAVELENAKDDTLRTVLKRQHAFKLGLYEHLQGLLQTAVAEEHWAKEANVKARLGVEPDLTPPPWMQQQVPPQEPVQQQRPSRRASAYPAMSWVGQPGSLGL